MEVAIIIPARMASTRFPGKPLAQIAGKAMIQRVWEIGKASSYPVFIATDDEALFQYAKSFGADVVMTSAHCLTGTDRVAEAAEKMGAEIVFSLQGDAVLTPPWVIEQVLKEVLTHPTIQIATPAIRLEGEALFDFANLKKEGSSSGTCVVFDKRKQALYFSKALIPFSRQKSSYLYRHIGLYAYRLKTLLQLSALPEGELEKMEKLEQLRALENGIPIQIVEVDYRGRTHGSVDLPEDVAIVESLIAQEGELV